MSISVQIPHDQSRPKLGDYGDEDEEVKTLYSDVEEEETPDALVVLDKNIDEEFSESGTTVTRSIITTKAKDPSKINKKRWERIQELFFVGALTWLASSAWTQLISHLLDTIVNPTIKVVVLSLWCIFITSTFVIMIWVTTTLEDDAPGQLK